MRCKTCDHSLWNQPVPAAGSPRVCSECGTPYTAADFDFGRGKVRFCCPTCDTGYYGTSVQGHLEPAEFDCIGCGARLTMDRCVIRAHNMEREHEAMQRRELPWLSPGGAGWIGRWWGTANLSNSNAARIAPMLFAPPQPLRAAGFLAINATLATIGGGLVSMGLPMIVGGRSPFGGVDLLAWVYGVLGMLAAILSIVAYAAIPAFLCSFLERKGRPLGFARAYELAAYSSGGLLVSLIPCCGPALGGIWWMAQIVQVFIGAFEGEPILTRVSAGLLAFVGFASGAVVIIVVAYLS